VRRIDVSIELDRAHPQKSIFRSRIEFDPELPEADRKTLLVAAQLCPVRRSLSKSIVLDESVE